MADIRLGGIDKVYPGGTHAVRSLDLELGDGELLVLLGPSGCGKSTVLRLVAGLEPLTAGTVHIGGRRVDTDPPDRRDVAMVFQSYALYGHMSVRDNIAFPLKMRGVVTAERERRVREIATMLELDTLLDARPQALSGGQQQRVAMGRALVRRPAAFLLDEPLSNLDARLRVHVREEIRRIQRSLGVTTVHVTHDQVEALSLGDRVAVMRNGALEQCAPGQELYDRPESMFVAAFVGQPGMNLLRADVNGDPAVAHVEGATEPLILSDHLAAEVRRRLAGAGRSGWAVGCRPEDLKVVGNDVPGIPCTVRAIEDLGSERVIHLEGRAVTIDPIGSREGAGDHALAARIPRGHRTPGLGDPARVAVPPEALHLFDPHGRALKRP